MLIFYANSTYSQFTQTLLSESWTGSGGLGVMFYKSTTKTDASRNVYVVGSTINNSNNSDIQIQKFNRSGVLLWNQTYAGYAGMNDIGTDVFIDNSLNVFVTGTVIDSLTNENDLVVLKYNSSGVFQWSYKHNGSYIYPQDAGTAITGDNSGFVYVTGTSGNDSTMYDYVTIKIKVTDGIAQWLSNYDHNQLNEAPAKIVYSGGNVFVTGASQDSLLPVKWKIATIIYSGSTGAELNIRRSSSSTSNGIDDIKDLTIDNSGNIYLTGAINSGVTGYDIAVYKLNSQLNLLWENTYDFNGLDDKGMGIKVNASGDIYVTGFSTSTMSGRETAILKLNSSGVEQWKTELGGSMGADDEGVQLEIDEQGRVIVAASVNNGNLDYKVYVVDENGDLITSIPFNGVNNLDDIPQSIAIDGDGNILITGKEQIDPYTYINKTVKYTVFDRDNNYVLEDSIPAWLEGNILVRFQSNRINQTAINKRNFVAGQLNEFIDSMTLANMQLKTGNNWSKLTAYKVCKNMTTADSLSVTRLGTTIKSENMWAILSIDIPTGWDIHAICDSLDSLPSFIKYASTNNLAKLSSVPIDQYYANGQLGLYPNLIYPGSDIDVEHAWDLQTGMSNIKVGILDAPISWAHNEFNGSITNLPGVNKKIGGGYNFYANHEIYEGDQYVTYNHGTSVAGIVGAKRNNYLPGNDSYAEGVAGIAGGNMTQSNFGVQLFSLGISSGSATFAPTEVIVEALHQGYSDSPSSSTDFGLNLINGSWGGTVFPNPILRSAIEECWRNHCVYIAARGNDNANDDDNIPAWPACFDDRQLLNVVASGTDGNRKSGSGNGAGIWSSMYGLDGSNNTIRCDVDFMAPGASDLITTTTPNNGYSGFDGTSASAPHVTGVAALMYSQHQTLNGYPNNLATEDIEEILQKTAVDKQAALVDIETGYGLIDANEAVTQVSDPYYVKHLTATPTLTLMYSGLNVYLLDNDFTPNGSIVNGSYSGCKKYSVNWNIEETLPPGHLIIDWWDLEAATIEGTYNYMNQTYTHALTGFRNSISNMVFNPIGGNQVHMTASTQVYEIISNSGTYWYPMHPSLLEYYFSVHVLKNPDASIEEFSQSGFLLYPNPSNSLIKIISKNSTPIHSFEIYDAMGRKVMNESDFNQSELTLNVENLKQGIYYCKIIS